MVSGPVSQMRPQSGVILTAALGACAIAQDDGGPRIVENTLASSWQSTGEWTLEEDLRLYGPPGGFFGAVGALATDSRDNIFVLDGFAQEIHVFDSEGAQLRTMGGQGEGPGEFRMAQALAMGPGDTLWVTDPMTRRYSVFGPDGGFARVLTRRINGGARGGAVQPGGGRRLPGVGDPFSE